MASCKSSSNRPRHCAFCLKLKTCVTLCSGCQRRAYCSEACQKQDWIPFGKGQGHKNYCSIEHGQEDVDWEMRPVPGKGLGLIAKRPIPALYRILIEGGHSSPTSHPGIADLAPAGATLQYKLIVNGFAPPDGPMVAGLRCSRVNHSCSPNAAVSYCSSTNALILYSCHDIAEGEEICRNYKFGNETEELVGYTFDATLKGVRLVNTIGLDLLKAKHILKLWYGIVCRDDCVCYQQSYARDFIKLRQLQRSFHQLNDTHSLQALGLVNKMLKLRSLYATCGTKAHIHMQATVVKTDAMSSFKIMGHMKEAYDILSIISPLSAGTLRLKKGLEMLTQARDQM